MIHCVFQWNLGGNVFLVLGLRTRYHVLLTSGDSVTLTQWFCYKLSDCLIADDGCPFFVMNLAVRIKDYNLRKKTLPRLLLNMWQLHSSSGWCVWLKSRTHPNGFEEVQVGQEVALGFVKPVTGGLADNFLSHSGHVAVSNVDKLLQRCGVTEVSEMEAKTFSQHLDKVKKKRRRIQRFR